MVRGTKPWEQYPTIAATLVGAAVGVAISASPYIPIVCEWNIVQSITVPRELYGTVALMSGTMTGIVMTNLTILTNWWTNPRMRLITASPRHSRNIWTQLSTAIWLLLATAIVSLAARQIDTTSNPVSWLRWVFWITSMTALFNTAQFIKTLIGIATIIRSPDPTTRPRE